MSVPSYTYKFLWTNTEVSYNSVPPWLLQVGAAVRVPWGYSATTALPGSCSWSSCSVLSAYNQSKRLTTGKNEKKVYSLQIYSGWSQNFQLYLKIYDFRECVKFGAISWKLDVLSITAQLSLQSKNPLHIYDAYDCE